MTTLLAQLDASDAAILAALGVVVTIISNFRTWFGKSRDDGRELGVLAKTVERAEAQQLLLTETMQSIAERVHEVNETVCKLEGVTSQMTPQIEALHQACSELRSAVSTLGTASAAGQGTVASVIDRLNRIERELDAQRPKTRSR